MGPKPSALEGDYKKYKHVVHNTKMVAEMGAGIYAAYQVARQAYPVVRAGMVAAGML